MSMRKFKVGMAAVLILGIVALFFVVPVLSQGPALPPGEYDLEAGQYTLNQHPLSILNLSVLDLSATPIPPTDTPIPPTDTPEPGHSNVDNHPVSADIGHTHNEQDLLEHIFGPLGAWHNGNEISFPWQTWQGLDADPLGPSSSVMENDIKHEGYKWFARDFGDQCLYNIWSNWTGNCITAFRIQTHSAGGAHGATTRLHGYSLEMRICTEDFSTCGILRTGGHGDYGPLAYRSSLPGEPYTRTRIVLPDDPPEFDDHPLSSAPYKHHWHIDRVPNGSGKVPYGWQNAQAFGWNQVVSFAFRTSDDWQGVDPDDPHREEPLCLDCNMNHSEFFVYRVFFNRMDKNNIVRDDLDGLIDGVINFSGFVDRQGNIVSNCSPLGPDCIPLILENVPDGDAIYAPRGDSQWIDYDLSPPGEWWIRHPN